MDFTVSIDHPAALLGLQRAAAAAGVSTQAYLQELAINQVNSVVGQHLVREMPPFTWLKTRFTAEERAAIRAAALVNGAVADLCAMTDKADVIHFDDPLTVAGIAQLEAAGLLAPGRGAEILAM